MPNANGRSVLIDQAMEMLGISRRTVYYWIRQGRLQTIRTRGGSQRVLLSSRPLMRIAPASYRPSRSTSIVLLSRFTA
jgi:excisionase family DNA binding protein